MESILFVIRQLLPDMPAAERRVAEYVLAEPHRVIHAKVSELSGLCGVSQAIIVRFCKRIGVRGFSDFKIRLSQDVFSITDERFLPDLEMKEGMDPVRVIRGVTGEIRRNMVVLVSLCNVHDLTRVVKIIRAARFTGIYGIGASGIAANDFCQKILRINIHCSYSADSDMQITSACNLSPDDAAFIFSYSGETPVSVKIADLAKKNGAPVISVTGNTDNSVRRLSDICLPIPAHGRTYRIAAMVSRISQFAVIDMIYSMLVSGDLHHSIKSLEKSLAATHEN